VLLQHRLDTPTIPVRRSTPIFAAGLPYRWHYSLLRGLEYFARVNAPRDDRLQDALAGECQAP
jgi:hypothetical protein